MESACHTVLYRTVPFPYGTVQYPASMRASSFAGEGDATTLFNYIVQHTELLANRSCHLYTVQYATLPLQQGHRTVRYQWYCSFLSACTALRRAARKTHSRRVTTPTEAATPCRHRRVPRRHCFSASPLLPCYGTCGSYRHEPPPCALPHRTVPNGTVHDTTPHYLLLYRTARQTACGRGKLLYRTCTVPRAPPPRPPRVWSVAHCNLAPCPPHGYPLPDPAKHVAHNLAKPCSALLDSTAPPSSPFPLPPPPFSRPSSCAQSPVRPRYSPPPPHLPYRTIVPYRTLPEGPLGYRWCTTCCMSHVLLHQRQKLSTATTCHVDEGRENLWSRLCYSPSSTMHTVTVQYRTPHAPGEIR